MAITYLINNHQKVLALQLRFYERRSRIRDIRSDAYSSSQVLDLLPPYIQICCFFHEQNSWADGVWPASTSPTSGGRRPPAGGIAASARRPLGFLNTDSYFALCGPRMGRGSNLGWMLQFQPNTATLLCTRYFYIRTQQMYNTRTYRSTHHSS
jgi:hypothetical protein